MIWLSVALILVEPVSAFLLASIVIRTHQHHRVPLYFRICLAALAAGLILHVAGQIEIILDYRPPRTLAWLGVIAPINAVIWSGWFYMLSHESAVTGRSRHRRAAGRLPNLLKHP